MRTVRDDDTFRTIVKGEIVFVFFYSVWNHACKRMKPAFKALAKQCGSTCTFATVDVNLCHEAAVNVDDLPTFHVYRQGTQTHAYIGTDGNELRTWVYKQSAV